MKKANIKVNDMITFSEEKHPYCVKAVVGNYVFCSRKFDKKEDKSLIDHLLDMQAFLSRSEALKAHENDSVYTIIDVKNSIRGPVDLIFGVYDFEKEDEIKSCLNAISAGECGISKRNSIPLTHFSINRSEAA